MRFKGLEHNLKIIFVVTNKKLKKTHQMIMMQKKLIFHKEKLIYLCKRKIQGT
jgi:hypothetical protein